MKKFIALAIVTLAFTTNAESPIKIEYSKTWYRVAKKAICNVTKSIKVEINAEGCKDFAIKSVDNAKELSNKTLDVIKNKVKVNGTETTNPDINSLI